MKKNSLIILISLLLISVIVICTVVYIQERDIDNTIPDNYIIVFKGESAETVHTTYVYDIVKKKKITYKYINTISTTSTYDSTAIQEEVIKKGTVKKKKKVFEKAKKNNAYSYVKYIKDDKIYSVEEFKDIFK